MLTLPRTLSRSLPAFLAIAAFALPGAARAQTSALPDSPGYLQADMHAALTPSAPEAASLLAFSSSQNSSAQNSARQSETGSTAAVSPIYPGSRPDLHHVVKPDMGPQPLTAGQKIESGLLAPYSLVGFGSNIFTAGWSHIFNTRPHYGTDKAGFGERLGAAEIKDINQTFLSYGLYAAIFHDDPHYYIMGPGHSMKNRAVYSASRVILTRTDSGGTGFNFAKLLGLASAGAVANAYYPERDRGFSQSASAFGTNILTSAGSNELNEFLPDVLKAVRHKKH